MRLEKRIRALEARMHTDPAILYFPDGSVRKICGRGEYLLSLFTDACGKTDLSPGQAADLDLIRQCVGSKEPGGGHLIELIWCFLHRSIEEPDSVSPIPG